MRRTYSSSELPTQPATDPPIGLQLAALKQAVERRPRAAEVLGSLVHGQPAILHEESWGVLFRSHAWQLCLIPANNLALEPGRGQKRPLLEQLAARTWLDPQGQPLTVAAETIRSWARRYREGGLAGLEDQVRSRRGATALTPAEVELVAQLKRDVPERSLDRLIHIAEETKLVEPGHLRRSTLHRTLRALGLSQTKARPPDTEDLDRFEAAAPNDLWQSDLLAGPWLPDPAREDRFSVLLAGTDELLAALRDGALASLRTRIGYAQMLRPFALEDTRNYIHFHLQRAEVDPKLFTEEAIKRLFQASQGRPRGINQLAMQALIQAAVLGRDSVDGDFMAHLIAAHPLYQTPPQDRG